MTPKQKRARRLKQQREAMRKLRAYRRRQRVSIRKMQEFREEVAREYIRANLFSSYVGNDIASIISHLSRNDRQGHD